ncbi:MAG: histidine kinase [Bacteroidota bacterium]
MIDPSNSLWIYTSEFWRNRLFFFLGLWVINVLIASSVIIISTGEINTLYWRTIENIAIRGFVNFSIYVAVFSVVIEVLSKRFPYNEKFVSIRLLLSVLIGLSVAYVSATINALFPFPLAMRALQGNFLFVFIFSFFQCGMVFSLLEIWAATRRNRALRWSINQLEKEQIKSQLHVLRQQINPHFLFNSLNVLSELIHEDLAKSDLFIQHFAKVYRYVLEINEETVVTLRQELAFLQSYLFLQRIRFGDNLRVEVIVPETVQDRYVPPLSLQVLFENAIKHNVISPEYPLSICVRYEAEEMLAISNNLQKIPIPKAGAGIGLRNLERKYRLISDRMPRFYAEADTYFAKLPLLTLTT